MGSLVVPPWYTEDCSPELGGSINDVWELDGGGEFDANVPDGRKDEWKEEDSGANTMVSVYSFSLEISMQGRCVDNVTLAHVI